MNYCPTGCGERIGIILGDGLHIRTVRGGASFGGNWDDGPSRLRNVIGKITQRYWRVRSRDGFYKPSAVTSIMVPIGGP